MILMNYSISIPLRGKGTDCISLGRIMFLEGKCPSCLSPKTNFMTSCRPIRNFVTLRFDIRWPIRGAVVITHDPMMARHSPPANMAERVNRRCSCHFIKRIPKHFCYILFNIPLIIPCKYTIYNFFGPFNHLMHYKLPCSLELDPYRAIVWRASEVQV